MAEHTPGPWWWNDEEGALEAGRPESVDDMPIVILELYDLGSLPWHGHERVHLYAEAWRRAYADRNHYLADPDFVDIPLKRMTSPTYAQERAK